MLEVGVISTSVRSSTTYSLDVPNQENLNRLLQQFNIPPLRLAQNGGPQFREIPLRPLLMPLGMLVFRMALLLYFVGPVRKPIFGVFFLAWILYELWQPLRNNLAGRAAQAPANGNAPEQNPNEPRGDNGPQNRPPPQEQGGPANLNPLGGDLARQWDMRLDGAFDNLADFNLQNEQRLLEQADQVPVSRPSLGQRTASFFTLFFATLHPALWNRRRTQLRRREGPIRAEASIRRQPDAEPAAEQGEDEVQADARAREVRDELRAKHARRPAWVQAYIERVVAGDWVDDQD